MQQATIMPKQRRASTLYARVKEENHNWVASQAKHGGYSVSEFTDRLIETARSGAPIVVAGAKLATAGTTKQRTKKVTAKRGTTRAKAKKGARNKK